MEPKKEAMSQKGQYVMVGAILGVAAGLLFGNLPALAVLGVGLGFLAGMMKHKK